MAFLGGSRVIVAKKTMQNMEEVSNFYQAKWTGMDGCRVGS